MATSTSLRSNAFVVSPSANRSAGRKPLAVNAVYKTDEPRKTSSSKTPPPLTTYDYVKTLPGISAPFNKPFFDPAGLHTFATINDMRRWRESELVHGRVAMLAALGFLVQEQLEDFPAFLNFDGSVTGPAIYHFQQIEDRRPLFWEILVFGIGLAESYRVGKGWATPVGNKFNQLEDDYQPGDLGFDPLGLKPKDPESFKVLQTKELNNGRLAMIAIAGFVAQELVNGEEVFNHLAVRLGSEAAQQVDTVKSELPNVPTPDLPSVPDVVSPLKDLVN